MEKVLTKAMDLCIEAGVNITDTVIDRAMRIGVAYVNNKSKIVATVLQCDLQLFVTEPWSIGQRKT